MLNIDCEMAYALLCKFQLPSAWIFNITVCWDSSH
jgi:hypothetical protein